MTSEENQLVILITKMQDRQEAMQKETSEHLLKLRENMHEIKSDYHGVSALTIIIREEIQDLKATEEKNSSASFARIRLIEKDIASIKPYAISFGKLSDNVVKVLTTIAIGAIISAMIFFGAGKE